MAVVEILKILGNYYAELYQDEDIEELKDIKVMFSRRYDLYKFKHIEELENYLKEMVIVICSGKENTKKKSKIVEEIVHYVENNYYRNCNGYHQNHTYKSASKRTLFHLLLPFYQFFIFFVKQKQEGCQ